MKKEEAITEARNYLNKSGKNGKITVYIPKSPQTDSYGIQAFSKKQMNELMTSGDYLKYSSDYWAFQFDTNNPDHCVEI